MTAAKKQTIGAGSASSKETAQAAGASAGSGKAGQGAASSGPEIPGFDKDALNGFMKMGLDAGVKTCEQMLALSQAQAEQLWGAAARQYGEATDSTKAQSDVWSEAGQNLAEDIKTINDTTNTLAREVWDQNVVAAEKMLGAKNLKEVVDIQTHYAQSSIQTMMRNGAELAELSMKMTQKSSEPFRTQMMDLAAKTFRPEA